LCPLEQFPSFFSVLMAYAATQRPDESGIRMALRRPKVLTRRLRGFLFGTTPGGPVSCKRCHRGGRHRGTCCRQRRRDCSTLRHCWRIRHISQGLWTISAALGKFRLKRWHTNFKGWEPDDTRPSSSNRARGTGSERMTGHPEVTGEPIPLSELPTIGPESCSQRTSGAGVAAHGR
jgi:hypothetical protein